MAMKDLLTLPFSGPPDNLGTKVHYTDRPIPLSSKGRLMVNHFNDFNPAR
ncbi:hypothetical protein MYX19_06045 [Nitrospinae bacterium AH-259-F20]|nr:hypothetical protein [Nitrospinae bacterium AH-259-F20]